MNAKCLAILVCLAVLAGPLAAADAPAVPAPDAPKAVEKPRPVADTPATPRPGVVAVDKALAADKTNVAESSNAFAAALYAKLAEKEGNLFLSPASIHAALSMTYAGAAGTTAEQMAKTLSLSLGNDRLHPAYAALLDDLNKPRTYDNKPAYELVVSNALWGQKGYPFKKDFRDLLSQSYGAGLNDVDFSNAQQASKLVNDWVAQMTKDKIKDLVPASAITPLTRLILTNAIYFKSNWADKFRKEATKDGPFHLSADKKADVPLMHQQKRHPYFEDDALQVLEMPYRMYDLSMVVVLPKKLDGLAAAEKLVTAENIQNWRKQAKTAKVDVTMPRFKFTSDFMLAPVLQAMGMTEAFDSAKADFSGMTDEEKLFIAAVIHKSFVAVDEEGTEAAAATAVMMAGAGMPPPEEPKVFKADHPFLFMIRHNKSGQILFLGRLADPSK